MARPSQGLQMGDCVQSPVSSEMLEAFSFPWKEQTITLDEFVPLIVREYTAGLTAAFVGRHAAAIDAQSNGLIDFVSDWFCAAEERSAIDPPNLGWDYAFGDAFRSMFVTDAEHARIAALASIAGHLAAARRPARWNVSLDQPLQLRWGDWLLAPARRIEIISDGNDATVRLEMDGQASVVNLQHRENQWTADAGHRMLRARRHGVSIQLLAREALSMRDYEDLLGQALDDIDPRMVDVFADALDLLAEYAPEYLPWVARTVHQLFLLRPRRHTIESGSVEHYLGLVHLTAHGEPLPVAELLLHEASHQHMNVIAKLVPLDDGSDGKRYWSPAVETERPLSKIIAAFHAFGNVMRFYRRCAENGLPNQEECRRQEALLGRWMDHLVPPLRSNQALTGSGRGLCHPLIAELDLA
jgi:HEXXH motif-containing protein